MRRARWIRWSLPQGTGAVRALEAFVEDAPWVERPPVVLWSDAISLRVLAEAGIEIRSPVAHSHLALVLAERRLLPERAHRWLDWLVAPVAASFRGFGVAAYASDGVVSCRGREVARGFSLQRGDTVVIGAALGLESLESLPTRVLTPGALRGLDWRPLRTLTPRDFEDRLRQRLEAQHDWQFDHDWPNTAERGRLEGRSLTQFA